MPAVTIENSLVTTEYGIFELDEIFRLLEELEELDSFTALIFYDKDIEKWLLSEKVVRKETVGSCVVSENFDAMYNFISDIIFKED